ncbi:MAG: hypothetical protein JXM73_09765 [Anaerolineae bacterium]|nr:hypothetical protein [Anaerolineae bacterium]
MTGEVADFFYPLAFLFLVPLVLGLLWYVFDEERGKLARNLGLPRAMFSLNLAYAYLSVDATVSIVTCLSLYYLTYTEIPAALSPTAWLVRWGGIALVVAFYVLEFPIKPIVRLLWQPWLARWRTRPGWLQGLNGISNSTWEDLLLPWAEGMRDSAHWLGLCILGGAVVPYLGILAVSWILEQIAQEIALSKLAMDIFDLLLALSDWGGAIVVVTLLLNLLWLSLPDSTIGLIAGHKEN